MASKRESHQRDTGNPSPATSPADQATTSGKTAEPPTPAPGSDEAVLAAWRKTKAHPLYTGPTSLAGGMAGPVRLK